jgi:hypothetical protein
MHPLTNLRLGRRSANWLALCFALLTTAALLFATADPAGAARHPNMPTHHRLCSGSAEWGPPAGEPVRKPGPTELVSGLYLDGGPHRFRSASHCASLSGTPGAGTITVTDPTSGAIVATETVAEGQLAKIRLPAGTYTIIGTFANASSDDQHIQSRPQTVTIRSGQTVRQDVSASIK